MPSFVGAGMLSGRIYLAIFLPNLSGFESNRALQFVQQKPTVLPLYSEVTPSLTGLPLMMQVVFTGAARTVPAAASVASAVRRVFMDSELMGGGLTECAVRQTGQDTNRRALD